MDNGIPGSAWQRFSSAPLRAFRAYADWLVRISWRRFFLLSVLLLISAGLLHDLPPFNLPFAERTVQTHATGHKVVRGKRGSSSYEITIDDHGVRIGPSARSGSAPTPSPEGTASAPPGAPPAPSAPPAPAAPAVPAAPATPEHDERVEIRLPDDADTDDVADAVEEALARADEVSLPRARVIAVRLGDYLAQTALLFILASAIIKISWRGRVQAEVKAAQATETAESESLKRQVAEARIAAMQAQIEPHFLFNTLGSIDHLIQVDPPRASAMQKHLIALLRASMPALRGSAAGRATLAQELAVVRPYLEILRMRMEERLQVEIDVPEGLHSAEFPPMMMQGLVENAIKHGLEPKPEGGRLSVRAEIVHGRLAMTVADTGLGFGKADTGGTGVGLQNIRERLRLLYGDKAQLVLSANAPTGTRATITVPYAARGDAAATMPA